MCIRDSYSSIHSIRGVLRPAFQLAVDDDLIRKNSFQFQLMEVVVNDSVTREAISRAEERKFLRFVKEDPHFCRYYEGIYILFKTGLRISEFCGDVYKRQVLKNMETMTITYKLSVTNLEFTGSVTRKPKRYTLSLIHIFVYLTK